MNFNLLNWVDPSSVNYFFLALFLNGIVARLWHKKIYKRLGLRVYTAIQRIHLAETPRLGGLIIMTMLGLYTVFDAGIEVASILKVCLFSIVPLILITLKEDLFHNVKPAVRLIALLASGVLFVINFSGPYPNFEEAFLHRFFEKPFALIIFYPIALAALANGSNLTDGVNGLCTAIFLSILGSLLFLAYQVGDDSFLMVIWIIMMLLVSFLCLNYPWGRVFLGDLGAYAIAFLTGMIMIMFFGRHQNISPWLPVLILIYPMTEVAFSIARRVYSGKSVFKADTNHLHINIFYFLRKVPQTKRFANPMVMPLLSVLWIYPLIVTPWVFKKPALILPFILIFFVIYSNFYRIIPASKN